MGIAELFASSTFLLVYSGLLVVLTAFAIIRNQLSISAEAKAARDASPDSSQRRPSVAGNR